ncbi:MAG TPA: beta-galactosidase trimerization domain-containing protein, partial [Candidatus Dormibacteraeota bacterium]|nr:beta-galactosidase trimerization domain-containing protein [Candidatus Dormibacteraeota bacterium]
GRGEVWSELIETAGANVLATFVGTELDRRPVATRHAYGKGVAFYVGTLPDAAAMERLLSEACAQSGIEAPSLPEGIESVRRQGRGRSLLFLLNHRDEGVDVPVTEPGRNLLNGSEVHRGLVRIGPRGVAVIQEGW